MRTAKVPWWLQHEVETGHLTESDIGTCVECADTEWVEVFASRDDATVYRVA